jgi:hypothetical protein
MTLTYLLLEYWLQEKDSDTALHIAEGVSVVAQLELERTPAVPEAAQASALVAFGQGSEWALFDLSVSARELVGIAAAVSACLLGTYRPVLRSAARSETVLTEAASATALHAVGSTAASAALCTHSAGKVEVEPGWKVFVGE